MADLVQDSQALREAARRAGVDFLRTELRLANTLLDVAGTGVDAQIEQRRRHAARAAYAEVEKHLVKGGSITFTDGERAELTTGLVNLALRFDRFPEENV
jgi:hypothetical protein